MATKKKKSDPWDDMVRSAAREEIEAALAKQKKSSPRADSVSVSSMMGTGLTPEEYNYIVDITKTDTDSGWEKRVERYAMPRSKKPPKKK